MVNLTWKKWLILKDIYVDNLGEVYYLDELAKKIGKKSNDKYFRETLVILVENDLAIIKKGIGNTKNIEIDINKLEDFLKNTEFYLHLLEFQKGRKIL